VQHRVQRAGPGAGEAVTVRRMLLPGGDRAVVELAKLTDYCLDETHPRGRHKARVFTARLGLTRTDAALLRAELLRSAANSPDAVEGLADGFGRRFTLDLVVAGPKESGIVRSGWIVRTGEDFPRLTSCYLL
jgi:hypothetical protein